MAIMRGITLALMAFLAMTSVAVGQVTLSYVTKDYCPCDGMKTFTVQATGTGLNILYEFDITYGQVHQVLTDVGVKSEWRWNSDGNTPDNNCDSHVVFGGRPTVRIRPVIVLPTCPILILGIRKAQR
jgi:hypothetical protein